MAMFESKRRLSVFSTTTACELTHSDLLVYSFLLLQKRWRTKPTNRWTAEATGLGEHTVAASLKRLSDQGFISNGEAELPADKRHWFMLREHYRKAEHECDQPKFTKLMVRAEAGSLSFAAVSVYSFIVQKGVEKFKPKGGWSAAYLAACLNLSLETVKDALNTLHEQGYLAEYEEKPFKLKVRVNLTEKQLATFSDSPDKEEGSITFDVDISSNQSGSATIEEEEEKVALKQVIAYIVQHCNEQLAFAIDAAPTILKRVRQIEPPPKGPMAFHSAIIGLIREYKNERRNTG